MTLTDYVVQKVSQAKVAAQKLATLPTDKKNVALLAMADALESRQEELLKANHLDLSAAVALNVAARDRLTLTPKRIQEMATGLRQVAALPDPVGHVYGLSPRPNGMQVGRMRVPIGVIGIIYESRPNVTADAASLCLKSGNAVVLRGGSEAIESNAAIVKVISEAGEKTGIPEGALTFIENPDREISTLLLKQDKYIDLIIPRGGEGLMAFVTKESRIPVIKHDKGVCHTYVDASANLEMAAAICFNAKVQRPGTCNAMETLLVHEGVAHKFLPALIARYQGAGVEVRGCPRTAILAPTVTPAKESDWGTEFLDLILAVRVVKDMQQALEHIARYGSQHSEAIITQDDSRALRFLREIDAAAVFVNVSTRLHDGFQFGLGAEIGISTSRIHARGAMGLEELTTSKFIVLGSGQLRE